MPEVQVAGKGRGKKRNRRKEKGREICQEEDHKHPQTITVPIIKNQKNWHS